MDEVVRLGMRNALLLVIGFLLPLSAVAGPNCTFTSTPFLPGNVAYVVGQSVTSSLSCTGTGTITYLWRLDGVTLPGETGSSFAFTPNQERVYIVSFIATDDTGSFQGGWERPAATKLSPTATRITEGAIVVGQSVVFQGDGGGDIDEYYRWSIFSDPNGNPSGGIQPQKQITFTPGSAGSWTIRLVLYNGVASEPADITFDVQPQPVNLPPTARLTADPIAAVVGETITLDGSGSSDPENDPLTYQWSLVNPPPGATPFPAATTQKVRTYIPIVPGDYRFRLAVKDELHVASDPAEQLVTVSAVALMPKFKVLLASNNKDYLFDDCAPFNDPCKLKATTHKAGEFLLGDEITLDASDPSNGADMQYHWTITGPGSANGDPNSCLALAPTTANKITCRLPSAGFGDYQIELKLSKSGAFSESTTKLASVEERIEIAFANFGEAPSAQKPYPTFSQLDYGVESNQWHHNGGKGALLKAGGCTITSLAMLARIKAPTSSYDPPGFNQYLASDSFKGFNIDNDVLWSPAVKALNSLGLEGPTLVDTSPWSTNPSRSALEHLARKRKMMILWTHSRNHSDQDNPAKAAADERWVTETGACSRETPNISECHKNHNHYMVVSGLGYIGGQARVLLRDPGYKNRVTQSLDHPRPNSGYDGQKYGVAIFTPDNLVKEMRPRTQGGVEAILAESEEEALLISPSGFRLGTDPETHQSFNEISGAVARASGIARGGDDVDGEALFLSTKFSLPVTESGTYTIRTRFNASGLATGSAVVLGSDGTVLNRKPYQAVGTAGAVAVLSFSADSHSFTDGVLSLSGMRILSRTTKRTDEIELHGSIALGANSNGISPEVEEVTLHVGVDGGSISASALRYTGGGWIYYEPTKKSGIYDFRLHNDNTFSIKARNLSASSYKPGNKANIELIIGDDRFSGNFTVANSIAKKLISITPDRLSYAQGDRAHIFTEILGSTNSETETVAVLLINAEEEFPVATEGAKSEFIYPLKISGAIDLEAQAYLQDKRTAAGLIGGIKTFRIERDEIRSRLEDGVDSETKENLEKRLVLVENRLTVLRGELQKIRTPIGPSARETIYVE